MIELMKLPFAEDALAPYVSKETVQFHYGKHHKAYVDKVNELIAGTEYENLELEDIIKRTYNYPDKQVLFNNAGQVYNHNLYWNSVGIGERLDKVVYDKINEIFGGKEGLLAKLVEEAVKLFGSGWVWLAETEGGELEILSTRNGDTPLPLGYKPLFNIDVWEHAYYLDYQNRRKDYAEAFIKYILKI